MLCCPLLQKWGGFVAGGLLLRVLLKMKTKAWSIGGTIQTGDERGTRRKTCCSATACITHPPGTGWSFKPDRLRHGTSVKAKNHVPFISKIQLPPHRKHSPLYEEQRGRTTWRFSGCWLWEPDATETHRAACGQIQRLCTLAKSELLQLPLFEWTTWPLLLCTWSVKPQRLSQPKTVSVCRDWGTSSYTCHCHTTHQTRAWHRLWQSATWLVPRYYRVPNTEEP
jgi:hypothetical protein